MDDEIFLDGNDWLNGSATYQAEPKSTWNQSVLYFDIETIPDYSRIESFNLPELPPTADEVPEGELTSPAAAAGIVTGTADDIKGVLARNRFPVAFLDQLEALERSGKARKGVIDLIDKARRDRDAVANAHADRIKLLSTTPEYCSIAALGWAWGDGDKVGAIVTNTQENLPTLRSETDLLVFFWLTVAHNPTLVGYNIIGFDLPVILARSAILGVPTTRRFDLSPWNKDIVDLYLRRFGARGNTSRDKPGKLKELASLYGLEIPAGDCDGSQVDELMKTREGKYKVADYVKSDVEIVRSLHKLLAGYFWD